MKIYEFLQKNSPATKPANHWGPAIVLFITKGRIFGITSGKAVFKWSDKPRFIEAFNATILCSPERVKCCLLITKLYPSLKSL